MTLLGNGVNVNKDENVHRYSTTPLFRTFHIPDEQIARYNDETSIKNYYEVIF